MRLPTLALIAALAAALPAAAQSGPPPVEASGGPPVETLGAVLLDADADHIPDRLGETVTVTGWAVVDRGTFGPADRALYVQDATGGIEIAGGVLAETDLAVRAGDAVVASGTLRFENGVAVIEPVALRRSPVPARVPEPVPYDSDRADAMEGRLVEAEGVVVGQSQVATGRALMVSLDDLSLVVVFTFDGQPEPVSFEDFAPGDRVHVTGVAGQYDRAEPFADSYQIYPRRPSDLRPAGIPASMYRWVALVAVVLLLLAVGIAAALRVQVRRRVRALQATEGRYQTLVDRASDAVFVHDLDGAAVEGNAVLHDALGLAREVTLPRLAGMVVAEDRERVECHLRRLRDDGTARTDLHLIGPDGAGQIFEVESRVVDLDGRARALSLGRDVGARRAYERGLVEAREQAENMARAKSAFLASMSHEIRTPLTAVIGFAEILRDEVDASSVDLVERIESGGHRLLSTLNSVLDLAQLDAGGHAIRPAPLDAADRVRESVALLRPLAAKAGLRLDVEAPDAAPAVLDAGALDRVLINLIGNAIKFTERGGVTVALDADADDLTLRVVDTGVGIDDAFLPELFAEFRQQSEGDDRTHEGSGLGLAITQRLVELMGGQIEVESERGVGTTFTVVVPRGSWAGDGAPAQDAAPPDYAAATASPIASGIAVS